MPTTLPFSMVWFYCPAMFCLGLALLVFTSCGASAPSTSAAPSAQQPDTSAIAAAQQFTPTAASSGTNGLSKSPGKLSSLLVQLADPAVAGQNAEVQARALGIPAAGAGSLTRDAAGAVLVAVRMSSVAEADKTALRDLGATIVNVSEAYSTITLYIQPDRLNDLAALPDVQNAREELHS